MCAQADVYTIQYNFTGKCQYTDCTRMVGLLCVHRLMSIQYSITLLPSVSTLIARGMFCGLAQAHSAHIHSNHKTFNYNNSK